MNKIRILMFIGSPFAPNVRVLQESLSLIKEGYKVYIIAWDRESKYPIHFMYSGINVVHITSRAKYGSGIKQIPGLIKFWVKAFFTALDVNPQIYHANDFYTLPLAFFISILKGKKLIYDSHENFPEFLKKGNPLWVSRIVEIMEGFFIKRTAYTITASEKLKEKFRLLGIKNVETIGNWKSKKIVNINIVKLEQLKKRFNITKNDFIVVYVGGLTRDRDIIPLINAIKGKKNIKAIIFGKGESRDKVKSACDKNNNAIYAGWIPLEDVPLCYNLADVIFYALKKDSPLQNFNAPNSLGFSLIFGKPILAYGKGDLKKIVQENRCGIILESLKPETIQEGLEKIKSRYKYYSNNAKKIGVSKYNWEKAEKKLLKIYINFFKS